MVGTPEMAGYVAQTGPGVQLQHVAQTGPVVQLQHVAATMVILPCQNGYYNSKVGSG